MIAVLGGAGGRLGTDWTFMSENGCRNRRSQNWRLAARAWPATAKAESPDANGLTGITSTDGIGGVETDLRGESAVRRCTLAAGECHPRERSARSARPRPLPLLAAIGFPGLSPLTRAGRDTNCANAMRD